MSQQKKQAYIARKDFKQALTRQQKQPPRCIQQRNSIHTIIKFRKHPNSNFTYRPSADPQIWLSCYTPLSMGQLFSLAHQSIPTIITQTPKQLVLFVGPQNTRLVKNSEQTSFYLIRKYGEKSNSVSIFFGEVDMKIQGREKEVILITNDSSLITSHSSPTINTSSKSKEWVLLLVFLVMVGVVLYTRYNRVAAIVFG